MAIKRVGHVVIRMRDMEKAKAFYQGVLGMEIGNEVPFGIFFRFKDYHHDIAVFKAPADAEAPNDSQVGLVHVALVCDNLADVKEMYDRCKAMGVAIESQTDHAITKSFYVKDPEGNRIEIYCDSPEYNWREEGMGGIARPWDFEKVEVGAAR